MEPSMWAVLFGLLLLVGGIMAIGGAALNLDVFMDSPKAKPFVDSLGRGGARVFYVILGALFAAGGIGVILYGIQLMKK